MNTLKSCLIALVMISSNATAWYPEYTVLASDFVLGNNFLKPTTFHTMQVYSLGEGFQDLYSSPMDDISSNPAAGLMTASRHFVQLDLGGQQLFDNQEPMFNEWRSGGVAYDYYYPGPWSQYRQTEEKEDYEPAMRFVYLGYPVKSLAKTRLGLSFDWIYGISEFYQPYDNWGFRLTDAMGSSYESSAEDPYNDYRLREAGDDENINQGFHLSLFIAQPLTSNTDIGARFTLGNEAVDGNYRDYNFNDQSGYYDEYVQFNEVQKERIQDFSSHELMLGTNTLRKDGSILGLSAGFITGNLERLFNEQDTSKYYSLMRDPYPEFTLDDSVSYTRTSNHISNKSWVYDGQTFYGGLQYRSASESRIQYRFSVYGEKRLADLLESESMLQNSSHASRYFYYYDTSLTQYSSNSWATLERSGSGTLEQQSFRGSGGINWNVSPTFRFLGGIFVTWSDRQLSAEEPFQGEKYAYTYRDGNYYNNGTDVVRQIDEKDFYWQRNERDFMLGIPVGFMLEFGQYFQLNSGLTKNFRKTEISENYDVIVQRYYHVKNSNGTITTIDDQDYVDGYEFPDIKTFDDDFDFNTGLSFIFSDNFSATVVFTNAFSDNYYMKLGAHLSW